MEHEIWLELKEDFQQLQAHIYHKEWEMADLMLDYLDAHQHLMDIGMFEELQIARARVDWMLNSE